MSGQILTFTNLFPSASRPTHGLFVQDRMRRVAEASGLEWQVVCPIPRVPLPLRRASDRVLAAMPPREEVAGVAVHHVPYLHLPGLSLRRQAGRIARACQPVVERLARGKSTVIDAHYVYPDGVAALQIADRLALPAVVTARGTDVNVVAGRPGIGSQVRAEMSKAAALFGVSTALCRQFDSVLGEPGRVQLARNGVDLQDFRPATDDAEKLLACRQLGLPEGSPLVLGVGRLIDGKGFHHAAAALRNLGGESVLVLVGEGPDQARIQKLLPAHRICFLGSLSKSDVATAYRASDLLVLPTYREGWPNVVTEALASGLPVVASAVGGIPEICRDLAVTRLVPPGDEAALSEAIAEFLATPPDAQRVRAQAVEYSWDDTINMLSKLFQELVA